MSDQWANVPPGKGPKPKDDKDMPNVTSFPKTPQQPSGPAAQGDLNAMANIKSLGVSATQPMMDDQQDTMTIAPVNSAGTASTLPSGQPVPTYSASPGTAVTLQPASDGLSCTVLGVKGQSGTEVVTASFTNADGTVATGMATYNMTIDATENDVSSFNVTTSTPTAQ